MLLFASSMITDALEYEEALTKNLKAPTFSIFTTSFHFSFTWADTGAAVANIKAKIAIFIGFGFWFFKIILPIQPYV